MSGSIFVIQGDGQLVAVTEQPYDSEDLLQRLVADYPDILAGDQMNSAAPRRWLLISREVAVPSEEGGAGRWSLDHLFVDQDATPTLVEVKRSTDTRIRREVVGQMLDYAANATVYWPIDSLRARFEASSTTRDREPAAALQEFLGPDADVDVFWQRVTDNLQAGRLRLVFLADKIPVELQRIVEFLNGQMSQAEVLAVEVRQYADASRQLRTLVPRVLGQTAAAQQRKAPPRRGPVWDEAAVFDALGTACTPEGVVAMRHVYEAATRQGATFSWGHGAVPSVTARFTIAGRPVSVWTCYAYGQVPSLEVGFRYMKDYIPKDRLRALADGLRTIPGAAPKLADLEQNDYNKGPALPIDQVLAQPGAAQTVVQAVAELAGTG
jgi:hypothetical protein